MKYILIIILCLLLASCGVNEARNEISHDLGNLDAAYSCGRITEQGEWIYYINLPRNSLFKAKINDTYHAKIISAKNIGVFDVYEDWIYYTTRSDDDLNKIMLYRIKKDGTEDTLIIDYCDSFIINDGKIYYRDVKYADQDSYQLISCDMNGENKAVLNVNISTFNLLLNDKIYYTSEAMILRRANFDGLNDEAILDVSNV